VTWQPIETAPKDGTDIMVYVGVFEPDYAVAHWNGEFWDMLPEELEADDYSRAFGQPTHWMHLPEPPADGPPTLHPDAMMSKLCDVVAPYGYGIESATLTWVSPLLNTGIITATYSGLGHDLPD
jgi:hypothetical protein